jgi:hypothetical protein
MKDSSRPVKERSRDNDLGMGNTRRILDGTSMDMGTIFYLQCGIRT